MDARGQHPFIPTLYTQLCATMRCMYVCVTKQCSLLMWKMQHWRTPWRLAWSAAEVAEHSWRNNTGRSETVASRTICKRIDLEHERPRSVARHERPRHLSSHMLLLLLMMILLSGWQTWSVSESSTSDCKYLSANVAPWPRIRLGVLKLLFCEVQFRCSRKAISKPHYFHIWSFRLVMHVLRVS